MPGREILFFKKGYYHIFNKTIDKKQIFFQSSYSKLFLNLMWFYRSSNHKVSYSDFKKMDEIRKLSFEKNINIRKYFLVEISCYCLMPNHFHLLLRQKNDNGVSKFISDTINSFTRFYNTLNDRKGPLFLSPFQAVEIRSLEQLIHVSRYIHLNPYSSSIVKNIDQVFSYPWSSCRSYFSDYSDCLVDKSFLLELFQNNKQKYKKFISDNADYQQSLERFKKAEKWFRSK